MVPSTFRASISISNTGTASWSYSNSSTMMSSKSHWNTKTASEVANDVGTQCPDSSVRVKTFFSKDIFVFQVLCVLKRPYSLTHWCICAPTPSGMSHLLWQRPFCLGLFQSAQRMQRHLCPRYLDIVWQIFFCKALYAFAPTPSGMSHLLRQRPLCRIEFVTCHLFQTAQRS